MASHHSSAPASTVCPHCGAPLPAEAPQGLCPKCLFARVGLFTDVSEAEQSATPHAQSPPLSPEELAPHFPQLEILKCLGRGGMGVVYMARQKSLDRLVALKLLAPERIDNPIFAQRFSQEAQALARLNHPQIVTIHDFGQAGGFFFLLMEFVDGVNLRQAMQVGRFTPEQALGIVPPICDALQYAHEHGIVHRDIKPENLLLDRDGRVKIADFGVAKILGKDPDGALDDPSVGAATHGAGTPSYMAPEQAVSGKVDRRADIYSLGVVLYEMLTGERPDGQVVPPSRRVQVDVRIDEIVLRALEKTPELRFSTASEFGTRVEEAQTKSQPSGAAAPAAERADLPRSAPASAAGKTGKSPWKRRATRLLPFAYALFVVSFFLIQWISRPPAIGKWAPDRIAQTAPPTGEIVVRIPRVLQRGQQVWVLVKTSSVGGSIRIQPRFSATLNVLPASVDQPGTLDGASGQQTLLALVPGPPPHELFMSSRNVDLFGPGEMWIGFTMPSVSAASVAVDQITEFHLNRAHGMEERSVLLLFSLTARVAKPGQNETLRGHLFFDKGPQHSIPAGVEP